MDESSGRFMAARGAAWRRRQRRLRSMLRHERQTVAAALHHLRGEELVTNDGLRAQRTASARPAEFYDLSSDEGRPAGVERPPAMPVPRPQAGIRRHKGVGFELVLAPRCAAVGGLRLRKWPCPLFFSLLRRKRRRRRRWSGSITGARRGSW